MIAHRPKHFWSVWSIGTLHLIFAMTSNNLKYLSPGELKWIMNSLCTKCTIMITVIKKTDIYYLLSNFGRHTGSHDSASLNASEACTILSSICKSWGCRTNCFSLTRVTSWLLLIRTANTKSWKMKMKETMNIVSPMLMAKVPKAHIQKPSTWKKYLPFQYQSVSCQWKVCRFNNRIWVLVGIQISSAHVWYVSVGEQQQLPHQRNNVRNLKKDNWTEILPWLCSIVEVFVWLYLWYWDLEVSI